MISNIIYQTRATHTIQPIQKATTLSIKVTFLSSTQQISNEFVKVTWCHIIDW